jgi:hypothetical protein
MKYQVNEATGFGLPGVTGSDDRELRTAVR